MKWFDRLRDALHPLALWAALARAHEEAEALRRVAEECASVEEARAVVERGLSEWCDVEPEAGS